MAGPTRRALITGASSGIGLALAEVFAARGFDLVVTARRVDRLQDLAARLTAQHGRHVDVVQADLSDPAAPAALCAELEQRGLAIDVLVNNAGYGVPGAYEKTTWESQRALLQVTDLAMTELTHRLLPGMLSRGWGRILNVASLVGFLPAPAGHTLYPASKALVILFSQALAEEVRSRGVHVTVLCPGFTLTEFHDVTGTRQTVSKLPGFMWSKADDVARIGFDAVMAGQVICVPGTLNRVMRHVARFFPSLFAAFQRRFSWSFRKV